MNKPLCMLLKELSKYLTASTPGKESNSFDSIPCSDSVKEAAFDSSLHCVVLLIAACLLSGL